MTTVEEVMQLCRLCLVKDKVNVPIFEEDVEIRQILTKINTLLPVKVSRNDNLPKLICKDCSSKLDMLYMFRKTSVESDKQLHSWLSSGPKETKPEVSVKQENFESTESRIEDEQVDAAAFLMQQEFEELDESGLEQESVRKKFKRTPKSAVETDDEDFDEGMAAKPEDDDSDEMDQTDYAEDPSVGTDDEQPGPSGVVKEATETPILSLSRTASTSSKNKAEECHKIMTSENCKYTSPIQRVQGMTKVIKLVSPDGTLVNTEVVIENPSNEISRMTFTNIRLKKESDTENTYTNKWRSVDLHSSLASDGNVKHKIKTKKNNENEKTGLTIVGHSILCDVCGKNIIRSHFAEHMKMHVGIKPFVCDVCGKAFSLTYYLRVHLRVHTREKPYMCQICGVRVSQRSQLNAHIRTHNKTSTQKKECSQGKQPEETEVFNCKTCGSTLKSKKNLREHMKTSHEYNPVMCDICGETCKNRLALKVHQRKHKEPKKVYCDVCGKSLSNNFTKTVHMRTHTGEKPFGCTFCEKKFSSKKLLVVHLRVHTQEKPYGCTICKKTFTQRSSLNKHKKTHIEKGSLVKSSIAE